MTTWQKIKLKLAQWFLSFTGATDFALDLLNDYLSRTNVAANVTTARKVIGVVLRLLEAIGEDCPKVWAEDYAKLILSIRSLYDALDDGQLSGAEVQALVEGVKIQYAEWKKD